MSFLRLEGRGQPVRGLLPRVQREDRRAACAAAARELTATRIRTVDSLKGEGRNDAPGLRQETGEKGGLGAGVLRLRAAQRIGQAQYRPASLV